MHLQEVSPFLLSFHHSLTCICYLHFLLLRYRCSSDYRFAPSGVLSFSRSRCFRFRLVVPAGISKSIRENSHIALLLCGKCPHFVKVVKHGIVLFSKALICVPNGFYRSTHLVGVVRHIGDCHIRNLGSCSGITIQSLKQ